MFDPQYQLTTSILNSIGKIEAARAVIENSPLIPLYERQFQTDATLRKVHFSTAIEGNYLQMEEVKKILGPADGSVSMPDGDGVVARKRDIHEVINYRDVVSNIEDLVAGAKKFDKGLELTEQDIFEIHKTLLKNIMDDEAGKYRTAKALTVNFATGEKLYPYEEYGNIEGKMRELIDWFNSENAKETHPVIKAGILHLELIRIHPFAEGNGRLARALATLSLSADGYDVNHFFCLDEYYDSNAEDYYSHLGQGFENLTRWIEYFALGMAIEFNRVKERVLKISKDAKVKEKSGQMFITERQEKIIEWLNTYGFFRNQDFEDLFQNISDDTVLRELKGLIDSNVVAKKGKTKSARYELK